MVRGQGGEALITFTTRTNTNALCFFFIVPGKPVPKGRPRFGKGRAYTPRETMLAERAIAMSFRATSRAKPLTGKVGLEVEFWYGDGRHGDLDNLVKTVSDALNGVAWVDDRQIVQLRASMEQVEHVPRGTPQARQIGTVVRIYDLERVAMP